jgi:hypothetical protein
MRQLRLYFRSDCSLCEDMHRELLASELPFELETVDIDTSEVLVSRYGHKVPVLTDASEHEICHYFLDRNALEGYFATH